MSKRVPLTKEQRHVRIRNYIDRMPSLPTTVSKVMEVCNKPDISPNDLSRVISLDPVLTGQVLKLINSAYYSLPNQITTLSRAIIMLGLNTVKNLALSTSILGTIGEQESFKHLPMNHFWTHSLGVGVIAKGLAVKKGVSPLLLEEYFVGGLLHDLGKIPLSRCFPEIYEEAFRRALDNETPLWAVEENILDFDHCLAGKMIAEKWQLASGITDVLSLHHHLDKAPEENQELVSVVVLANFYANEHEIGTAGDHFQEKMPENLLERLQLSRQDVASLYGSVNEEIEKAQIFLKVSSEVQA